MIAQTPPPERAHAAGSAWVASDGNGAAELTCFSNSLGDLAELVDWALMRERVWKNTDDDRDRMRRRMAEFLVHREFPIDLVAGYAVRTRAREQELRRVLRQAGIIDPYVRVRGDWYYGFQRGEVRE